MSPRLNRMTSLKKQPTPLTRIPILVYITLGAILLAWNRAGYLLIGAVKCLLEHFDAIISFSAKKLNVHTKNFFFAAGQDGAIPPARVTTDETVAICVLGRNENSYIKEWADHHFALGIDKIYLYDHNSDTPMDTEIPAYVQSGQVVSTFFKTYDFVPSAWDNYTHGNSILHISPALGV